MRLEPGPDLATLVAPTADRWRAMPAGDGESYPLRVSDALSEPKLATSLRAAATARSRTMRRAGPPLILVLATALVATACRPAPIPVQTTTITLPSKEPSASPPIVAPLPAKLRAKPDTVCDGLRAVSVRTRLPELAKRQADRWGASPTSVWDEYAREAIEQATADMFVRYVSNGAASLPAAPWQLSGDAMLAFYLEVEVPKNPPELAKYAENTRVCYAEDAPYIPCISAEQPPLADGAPGLVWDVTGTTALFLSLDGETYEVDLGARGPAPRFEPGPGAVADWPAPVGNPSFTETAARVGRRKLGKAVTLANKAFAACAAKNWARAGVLVARGKTGDAELDGWIQKGVPGRAVQMRYVRNACSAPLETWQKAYAASIEASAKERLALYEIAKARVLSMRVLQAR